MLSQAVDILRLSCVFAVSQPDDGLSHYSTLSYILGLMCKKHPHFSCFLHYLSPILSTTLRRLSTRYSGAVFHFIHIPYDDE